MNRRAFKNYIYSIQARIGKDLYFIKSFEMGKSGARLQEPACGTELQGNADPQEAALAKARANVDALKTFFLEIQKKWGRSKDRTIGFVQWAPPIAPVSAPHRYMQDLCVVELYKEKFTHLEGNLLSFGEPPVCSDCSPPC